MVTVDRLLELTGHMRASRQEQVGGAGVSEVSAAFERLGWGFAENSRHDLGTDLFVLARDERLFDLGLVVGIQVKTGEESGRYFREHVQDRNGRVCGWWFRDTDRRHIDAWLSHALPHLIVLHDLSSRMSYWQHVTEDTVVSTGKGAKVLVPKANTIADRQRDALLRVAASNRPGVMWERSAWTGAASVLPRDLLRHALLVPRLVAPHPNPGYGAQLTPEQAIALLVQARVFDLERFAAIHADVPSLDEAAQSQHWSWRFVGALGHRVTTGEICRVLQVIDDAPDASAQTAATVTAAVGLLEEGRVDDALELLEVTLARDEAEPVDHAWLTLQHARMCAEVGRLGEARAEAISVQKIQVTSPDDVTATAIAGAAAELLFNTSTWGQHDIEDVITGADTAASWWRTQTTSWALTALADRTFKEWSQDSATVVILGGTDTVNNQLLAASLTANYAGDHADWRHLSALLGQDQLLRLDRHADPEKACAALEILRLAGDESALRLAVQRLAADGPATAITLTAANVRLDRATRTTGRADLALLQYGGDVLDEETAGRAVTWLLATLDDPSAFVARTTPSYLLDLQLIDTVAAVAPAAPAAALAAVIDHMIELPGQKNQTLATSWAKVVDALPNDAWTEETALRAGRDAGAHDPALRFPLLALTARYSETARAQLMAEARGGSLEALAALGDVRDLPAEVVAKFVISLSEQAEQQVRDAQAGAYNFGDVGRTLALLNVRHPASAKWDPLLRLLADDTVAGGHKIGAFQVLTSLSDHIPDKIRKRLAVIAKAAAERPSRGDLPPPIGGDAAGAAAQLAAALGALDAESIADRLLGLLAGDQEHQRWAARIAHRIGQPEDIGVLVTLAQASDANIRATAAAGLASLVAAGRGNALAVAGLRRCVQDPGTRVPALVAAGIANAPARTPAAGEVLTLLRGHASAHVRATVTRALRT